MYPALWLSCLLCAQVAPESPTFEPSARAREIVAALESVVADSVDQARDSVVAISRSRRAESDRTSAVKGRAAPNPMDFRPMAGFVDPMSPDFQSFDNGSGVVIGAQGQILTAFHVVQGADAIFVRAADRQEFYAEIIAADPRSDLAVLMPKLSGPQFTAPPKLKPIRMGQSEKLRQGSFVVALGNPFNAAKDGKPSAAFGIVSNRSRRLDLNLEDGSSGTGRQLKHLPTLLQLDSKLNLGMSGGAVVNMNGELVGISTSGGTPQGFDAQAGYAIPIDGLSRRVIAALMDGRAAEYGFLGVSLSPGGSNAITQVTPNTPAAKAGLVQLDEIVSVGGIEVDDGDSLVLAVNELPVDAPVKIVVRRQNKMLEKEVRLARFPVSGEVIATNKPAPWRGIEVDFSYLINFGPRREFQAPVFRNPADEIEGVIVTEVDPESPAFGKLTIGSLIVSVDGKAVKSPSEFRDVVKSLKGPVRLVTLDGPVEIPE
jgi:S1-C subfamily serine protease